VLEELVGEIQDEFDQESPPVVKVPGAEEDYLAEGTVPLYQLNSFCGLKLEGGGVDTLSGYLIKTLGRIPILGEEIRLENLVFIIKKVGRRRIHQVLVRKLAPPLGEEKGEEASS
jgi:CBS domain containing-hemolysin-like protein